MNYRRNSSILLPNLSQSTFLFQNVFFTAFYVICKNSRFDTFWINRGFRSIFPFDLELFFHKLCKTHIALRRYVHRVRLYPYAHISAENLRRSVRNTCLPLKPPTTGAVCTQEAIVKSHPSLCSPAGDLWIFRFSPIIYATVS